MPVLLEDSGKPGTVSVLSIGQSATANRILIAYDHPIVRCGLRMFLGHELEAASFGEAGSSREVLLQVQRECWDLLILDMTMPGRSGLDALNDIKQERGSLPVLILSEHSEEQFGKKELRAGTSGYISKESSLEELIKAIRKALAGGTYVSPRLAEKLAINSGKHVEQALHEWATWEEGNCECAYRRHIAGHCQPCLQTTSFQNG